MSDDDAIETAFHAVTEAQGGTHIADGGWWWLEGFGDLGKEYAAIRDDVAVWDVSPLNKWDFRGPAALEAAQRVFSNDALGLEVGQARYGAFLDADGLMVDDGTVFNTGGDHCWVMTNGKDHADYFGEALQGFDVEFEWIAPRMPHLGVIGPRSREVVQKLTDADVGALRYFRFLTDPVKVAGVEVFLSRTGFGGELGYELFLTDPADAEEIWNAIVGAGVTPFGAEAIEPARIEAGLIVTDYDYEAHQRTPYDFNLDRLVRLDGPGEFLGKEKLREVAAAPPKPFRHAHLRSRCAPRIRRRGHAGQRGGRRAHEPDRQPTVREDRARGDPHRPIDARQLRAGGRRRRHGRRDRRRLADLRHEQGPAPLLDLRRSWSPRRRARRSPRS
jgi:aminomethyltransferase